MYNVFILYSVLTYTYNVHIRTDHTNAARTRIHVCAVWLMCVCVVFFWRKAEAISYDSFTCLA